MNTDDSVDQIANNTSPFHFTETDTIDTPAIGSVSAAIFYPSVMSFEP